MTQIDTFQTALLDWATDNTREYLWREQDRSLYEVFLAEFLLTQTPADNVATVYPELIERYPSLDAIRRADEDALRESIEPLGFQNIRTEALTDIASEYRRLPETASELMALPRVGRYVANTTVCLVRNERVPILDRNVERVYERFFGSDWPDSESEQWDFAAEMLPAETPRQYNMALLDFGAMVCQPDPNCESCPLSSECSYYRREVGSR